MKLTMNKLLFALIAFVSMVFVTPMASAAGEVRLYVSPAASGQTSGGQFDVTIRVSKSSSDRVDYARVGLTYPASKLEVVSVNGAQTAFNKDSSWLSNINNSAGVVYVSGESDALSTPADVLVATVKFRSKSAGRADLGFSADSTVGDLFGPGKVRNYLTSSSGAVITVSDPPVPATTLPSSRPAASTPAASPAEAASPDTPVSSDQPTGDVANGQQAGTGDVSGNTEGSAESADGSSGIMSRYGWIAIVALVIIGLATTMIIKLVRMHKSADMNPVPFGGAGNADGQELSQEEVPEAGSGEWPLFSPVTAVDEELGEVEEVASLQSATEEPQSIELNPIPDQIAGLEQIVGVSQPKPSYQSEPVSPTNSLDVPQFQTTPGPEVAQEVQIAESISPVPSFNQAPVASSTPVATTAAAPVQNALSVPVIASEVVPTVQAGADDDIPDMFEVGEARLRQEGYVSNIPPRPQV